jgi:DNA-binding transcriptional regulator YiaG
MPNLVGVLKEEIRRLARKEIRPQAVRARKAAAQYRREIAQLKQLLEMQRKRIAALESAKPNSRPAPAADGLDGGERYSVRSIRAQRRRLKLSAEKFGRLLGVATQTVYHWETGKSRPRAKQFARIVEVRKIGRREALRRLAEGQGKSAGRTARRKGAKPRPR